VILLQKLKLQLPQSMTVSLRVFPRKLSRKFGWCQKIMLMVLLIIIVSILVITRNQCELELYHIKSQVCRNLLEETSNDIRTLGKNLYIIFLLFLRNTLTNITIPLSAIVSLSTFHTATSSLDHHHCIRNQITFTGYEPKDEVIKERELNQRA